MLVILTVPSLASGAPNKDKDKGQEFTQVYWHTYDEVFQASQVAIERLAYFVTGMDKDKGTISGNTDSGRVTFDLHIEALNTKPQSRVTIKVESTTRFKAVIPATADRIFKELQKVLATYH